MTGPNEIDPPQPTPFEALVRRLAEEAIETETVSVDDLLQGGRLTSRYLERFARLVVEECAKRVAECAYRIPPGESSGIKRMAHNRAVADCLDAIRGLDRLTRPPG